MGDDRLEYIGGKLLDIPPRPGELSKHYHITNDDVPNFLKKLDKFEKRSAKTKIVVK